MPVVGRTTLEPGESTTVTLSFTMHEGMGGPHEFVVPLRTNDAARPEQRLTVKSDWVGR
jgi:hypothetical protein